MIVGVEPGSPVPPFEQVRAQLASAIHSGELGAEQRLPTVRQLAADLSLAANTVARAYRELELAGLIETQGRHGSFVAAARPETRREALQVTRDFADAMRDLGIGAHEMVAMLQRELDAELSGGRLGATAARGPRTARSQPSVGGRR
jgi:DNA-binding transcriptional regulator YhcF (GntR family)